MDTGAERSRMKRSQGIPARVDFVTDPCTLKWTEDFALPARSSVNRLHWALPMPALLPRRPSRTKFT
jgi:hypothetical protein